MTSIIIVTHQNADDIQGCLDTLPWQSEALEIIVVDNHSTDGTAACVASHPAAQAGKLRLVQNTINLGYAAAINQGLRMSRGEWVLILGPDASLEPEALCELKTRLLRDPGLAASAPLLVDAHGRPYPSCRRFPRKRDILFELTGLPRFFPHRFRPVWKMPDFDFSAAQDVEQPEATCLLIRREAINQVGGMDERFSLFFNDVDWCRRFYRSGWRIGFTPTAHVHHKKGTSVLKDPLRLLWKSHQGCYRYFWKYREGSKDTLVVLGLGLLLIWVGILRTLAVLAGWKEGRRIPTPPPRSGRGRGSISR